MAQTSPESASQIWRGFFLRRARGIFLTLVIGTTIAAPWMIGSEVLMAQWALLIGASASCLAGLLVRLLAPASRSRLGWILAGSLGCGALFLGQLAVQSRNPSHAVVFEKLVWHLEPLPSNPKLPQSLDAPFDFRDGDFLPYKNTARYLLIFGAAWLYAASLALGMIERKDAVKWAVGVGLNGIVLAIVCLVHRAMHAELTLWRFGTTFDFSRSPIFYYKNHNGAYLAASLAVVVGLAASRMGAWRRVWEIGALIVWLATVAVNSRVATATATLWIAFYLSLKISGVFVPTAAKVLNAPSDRRRGLLRWGLGGCAIAILGFAIFKTGGAAALARFVDAWNDPFDFARGGGFRPMAREIGWYMWLDRPFWGWGGGAYLYLFNTYHVHVPAMAAHMYAEQPQLNRFFGAAAVCDWIEFFVEYGICGVGLMLGAIGFPIFAWMQRRGWRDPLALFLISGAAGLIAHAYYDYILRNPALLVLLVGVIYSAVRVIENSVCNAEDTR